MILRRLDHTSDCGTEMRLSAIWDQRVYHSVEEQPNHQHQYQTDTADQVATRGHEDQQSALSVNIPQRSLACC
jgi:hypothetical protein